MADQSAEGCIVKVLVPLAAHLEDSSVLLRFALQFSSIGFCGFYVGGIGQAGSNITHPPRHLIRRRVLQVRHKHIPEHGWSNAYYAGRLTIHHGPTREQMITSRDAGKIARIGISQSSRSLPTTISQLDVAAKSGSRQAPCCDGIPELGNAAAR